MPISTEAKAAYDREHRAKNRARVAEVKRLAHLADPTKQAARSKKWDAENKERSLAIKKKYRDKVYVAHPVVLTPKPVLKARAIERAAAWSAANPERKAATSRAYCIANADALKEAKKRSYAANREERCAYSRAWHHANPERAAKNGRAFRENRPELVSAAMIRRKRQVEKATPPWADLVAMRAIYKKARASGMHVDHVIPLQGKQVSGLHVHTNLQLLTPAANQSKGNKFNQEAACQ